MTATTAILRADWSAFAIRNWPFRWAFAAPGTLFDQATAQKLCRSFPTDGMIRRDASDRDTGKRYRNYSLPVGEGASLDMLPELWCKLFAELRAPAYRQRMAALLDQPMAGALELRLVRHGPDDWLGPHTDSHDKLFTMIIYLNEAWTADDGGALELLTACDASAVAERVLPQLGAAVVLVPSDVSWHQVQPVRIRDRRHRQSLLIHATR